MVFLATVDPVQLSKLDDRAYYDWKGWVWLLVMVVAALIAFASFKRLEDSSDSGKASKFSFVMVIVSVLALGFGTWMLVNASPWTRHVVNGYDENISKIESAYGITDLKLRAGDNVVQRVTRGTTNNDGDYTLASWTDRKGKSVKGFAVAKGDKSTKIYLSTDNTFNSVPYEP